MNHLTSEREQREYLEKCRAATLDLIREERIEWQTKARECIRKTDELLDLLRQKSEQREPVPMPQYARD